MLRYKFWTGLKDDQLKDASRHKYDTIKEFGELLKEVRKIEQELSGTEKFKKKVQVHQSSTVENSSITEKLNDILFQVCRI